jgi:hypothetical protein
MGGGGSTSVPPSVLGVNWVVLLGGFIGAPLLCLGGPKRQQGELFPCDTNVEGRAVCSRTCKGEGFTHNTNVEGFALGHARTRGLL